MDKYDEQINQIMSSDIGQRIGIDWIRGYGLFSYCTPNRSKYCNPIEGDFGCLTLIKSQMGYSDLSYDPKLGIEIQCDPRIHSSYGELTVDVVENGKTALEPYAEYQRKMDAMWPGRYELI